MLVDTGGTAVAAVDGVDLRVRRGETLGLVGESGCGKSLTALALVGLLPSSARCEVTSLRIGGVDATDGSLQAWRAIRGRLAGLVPQDSGGALNPVFTVGYQLTAVLRLHQRATGQRARQAAVELLSRVRLRDPVGLISAYPHQLSGGMRQRVALALALAGEPAVLIADEPTTALDAPVKLEILELLLDTQRERQLATLFITHDIGLLRGFATHMAVMYAGRIVECGPAAEVLARPAHPYTKALLAAMPSAAQRHARLTEIPGHVPPVGQWPTGCRFATRCKEVVDVCCEEPPARNTSTNHLAWCHVVVEGRDRPS